MSEGTGLVHPPTLDWRFKGFPPDRRAPLLLADVASRGWNVRTGICCCRSPCLSDVLTHNIAAMAEYCREQGVSLAPHAKTSMAPALLREQAAAGAWGFTVANTTQAIALRALGFNRLLLASQMVEPRAVAWAAEALRDPSFELLVLADSIDAVAIIDTGLRAAAATRPLRVLVEFGQVGGRSGCRTPEEIEAVVKAIAATDTIELAGVEGFEGLIPAAREDMIAASTPISPQCASSSCALQAMAPSTTSTR